MTVTQRLTRELRKIQKELRRNDNVPMHAELMAAQQALSWVLDPKQAMAPCKYITTLGAK